jgi:predicted anti-sigma-YlaC factor YlaD
MWSRSDECEVVDELLEPWVDGDLEPTDQRRVDDHLVACACCRQAAESADAIAVGLRALPELEPPESILAVLPSRASRPSLMTKWWRGAAAAAVLMAAGGAVAWHHHRVETRQLAVATLEARYALGVVARASSTAGRQVANGIALDRIVRTADRPAVRALKTSKIHGG